MFQLTKEQYDKLDKWKKANDPEAYCGCIAGRWTYCFTPTSLGLVTKVKDNLKGLEINLTNYNDW